MAAGQRCNFCYRRAVTPLTRHRRTLWQIIFKRPPSQVFVCSDHIGRGLTYVRKGL